MKASLTLGESTSDNGWITGTVQNGGTGVPGVSVTAELDGTIYEAETDALGTYSVSVPVGEGYRITAVKQGYTEITEDNIRVKPAASTQVDLTLIKDFSGTTYLYNLNFQDMDAGEFTGDGDWKVTVPGNGDAQIVEKDGRKYLRLSKTGSGTIGLYNDVPAGLDGTVTVEARVMRTIDGGGKSADQFAMYSFNQSDWKAADPATSSNPMGTLGLSRRNIITHNVKNQSTSVNIQSYQLNQWYVIRNVIHVDTGTFDFYVNDMTTSKWMNQPLRTSRGAVDHFLFYENGSNTGDLCLDYFRVCQGTPYDYDDAGIQEISVDGVELTKAGDTDYRASVDAETECVTVRAKANSEFAVVTVNGEEMVENGVLVDLEPGENTITVLITAEDQQSSETFTITIERADPAVIAQLKSLSIRGVEMTPEFSPDILEYAIQVENETESVILDYEAVSNLKINQDIKNSGLTQAELTLEPGGNVYTLQAGSSDGTNWSEVYTLTIIRKETKENSIGRRSLN